MRSATATLPPDRAPARWRLRLSLRLAMQAAIAALGLALVGVLGATAHSSWRSHATAEQARDRMRAAAALGDALGAALSERQFTINVLARATPLAPTGQAKSTVARPCRPRRRGWPPRDEGDGISDAAARAAGAPGGPGADPSPGAGLG